MSRTEQKKFKNSGKSQEKISALQAIELEYLRLMKKDLVKEIAMGIDSLIKGSITDIEKLLDLIKINTEKTDRAKHATIIGILGQQFGHENVAKWLAHRAVKEESVHELYQK